MGSDYGNFHFYADDRRLGKMIQIFKKLNLFNGKLWVREKKKKKLCV